MEAQHAGKKDRPKIIDKPCVIIVSPTDAQIDSMKKVNEDDFYTIADDSNFYIGMVRLYLDSIKTPVIDIESKGTLSFRLANKKVSRVNMNIVWGLFLYNGKDKPLKVESTEFAPQYLQYMPVQKASVK